MSPRRSRATLWAFGPRAKDETGSMAMYLTIAVVGLALAALLVPMLVTQTRTTRLSSTRVHAVDAAQAGIDAMVGRIRAAKIEGVGTSTLLPCDPMTGKVDSSAQAAYQVKVDYYMADPVTEPTAAKMRCVQGYGTYDNASDSFTPRFARITSTGTDGTAFAGGTRGRTLVTTYVFRTDNTNIAGGRIRLNPATTTSPELCIDAGPTPTANGIITIEPCTSPVSPQQSWAYRSDLTIQLLSSIGGTYPEGLCLDTQPPLTDGRNIELGICSPLGTPPYRQQWSYNDNGGYQGSHENSAATGNISPLCMTVSSQNAGVIVRLGSCGGGGAQTSATTQAWIPDPAVGAGAASLPQIINYYEFGRCLDVTNQDVTSDHMINYPCKQNPFPGAVRWNQKFTVPGIPADAKSATGEIFTTKDGVRYCMTSAPTNGGYTTVSTCSGADNQRWTVYGGHPKLRYSSQYTIVDSAGRCLGLTAPVRNEVWSAIDVETCTGATEQKWNAAPNLTSPALQDLDEL